MTNWARPVEKRPAPSGRSDLDVQHRRDQYAAVLIVAALVACGGLALSSEISASVVPPNAAWFAPVYLFFAVGGLLTGDRVAHRLLTSAGGVAIALFLVPIPYHLAAPVPLGPGFELYVAWAAVVAGLTVAGLAWAPWAAWREGRWL
jgi:hypothetical protein